jgi:succinylarginine dihydrolase
MGRKRLISVLDGILLVVCCAAVSYAQNQPTEIIPVEVFHVGQLPVAITNVELVGSAKGFQLRCSMTNNSDEKLLGFRYSIVAIDSNNAKTAVANRSEAWALRPYATKRKTFGTLLPTSVKNQVRVVLMLEQIVGAESIWEVIKAKDALDSYTSGDFSKIPTVLRVPNHVDVAPQQQRIIY